MADLDTGLGLPEGGAPAEPSAPTAPATAEHAAIEQKDFSAFREARRDTRRTGVEAPAPAPAAPAPVAPPAAAAPAVPDKDPRRHVRQSEINEQIRRAVEQATTPLLQELGRVRQAPASATPAATTAPAPDWQRYAQHPQAPKLDQFESLEAHTAAMALFITEQREADRARAQAFGQHQAAIAQQAQEFGTRMSKAAEADPSLAQDLAERIPALHGAKPLSALTPQELPQATFANVAAEALFRSEQPGLLARHLLTHPEETDRIGKLPADQWLLALSRLDGRLAGTTQAPAPASVTPPPPATPPPTTLGTRASAPVDPEHAALASGDFTAYRQARLRARLAERV